MRTPTTLTNGAVVVLGLWLLSGAVSCDSTVESAPIGASGSGAGGGGGGAEGGGGASQCGPKPEVGTCGFDLCPSGYRCTAGVGPDDDCLPSDCWCSSAGWACASDCSGHCVPSDGGGGSGGAGGNGGAGGG